MPIFGDVIENGWASQDNPHRRGFFVRQGMRRGRMNSGPFYVLTDGRGEFWETGAGPDSRLSVAVMSRAFDDAVLQREEPTEALAADGEKLRGMTGQDHGPWAVIDALEKKCAANGHYWAQSTMLAPFTEYCQACGAIRDIAEKGE